MKVNLSEILHNRLNSFNRQIKQAIYARNHAPDRNEARYDSSRGEQENLLDSLSQEKKNLLNLKKSLSRFPKFNKTATLNSLVTLKSHQAGEKTYLLVPEGLGGSTVNSVFLLSINSLLAQKFLNQKTGFQFNFNDISYQIASIQPN